MALAKTSIFLFFLIVGTSAGGNLKRKPPSPRLRPGTRAISPLRINSGRVRPSETNGRSPAWGTSTTNTAPVRPGLPGASVWPRPYTPQAPGSPKLQTPPAPVWPRPYTPQAPGSPRLPTPQTPVWSRPYTPQAPVSPRLPTPPAPVWSRPYTPQAPVSPRLPNPPTPVWSRHTTPQAPGSPRLPTPPAPVWPRLHTPQAPGSPRHPTPPAPVGSRPHTPQAPVWFSPQTSQASGWPRPQTPVSSVSRPQSPTSNFFPELPAPKQTYAEAEEQRRLEKNNTFNTGPNDRSIDGSITKVETDINGSPNSRQPSNTQFRTDYASGSFGYRGVTYVRSEEHDLPRQPNQNQIPGKRTGIIVGSKTYQIGNTFKVEPGSEQMFGAVTDQRNLVFKFVGDKNKMQPNGVDIHYGSSTVQINNKFTTNEGAKNSFGSHLYRNDNVYPDTNARTEEIKHQNIESQAQLPNSSNLQLSLTFNFFYLYSYFCIVLSNYFLL